MKRKIVVRSFILIAIVLLYLFLYARNAAFWKPYTEVVISEYGETIRDGDLEVTLLCVTPRTLEECRSLYGRPEREDESVTDENYLFYEVDLLFHNTADAPRSVFMGGVYLQAQYWKTTYYRPFTQLMNEERSTEKITISPGESEQRQYLYLVSTVDIPKEDLDVDWYLAFVDGPSKVMMPIRKENS